MKIKDSYKACIFFLAVISVLHSCKTKSETYFPNPDLSTEKEFSNAQADLNSIFRDVDYTTQTDTSLRRESEIGYRFTKKDTAVGKYGRVVTIFYENKGRDGLSRSGKLRCFTNGRRSRGDYRDSVILDSVRINSRMIQGFLVMVQTESKILDQWNFTYKASVVWENQSKSFLTLGVTGLKSKVGLSTKDTKSDIWLIIDTITGKNSQGQQVRATTALTKVFRDSCSYRHPIKGMMDFTNHSSNVIQRIKYGDGECDDRVTFINEGGWEYAFFVD